jgi:alpha-glucoside transport system permease protein
MSAPTTEVTNPSAVPKPQRTSASREAKKRLTSPWASFAAAVIAILWTVPTAGLLISSFRPENDVKSSGWWNFFIRT